MQASSLLIDHPAVLGVLHTIIGPDIRIEAPGSTVRQKGEWAGALHGGGPSQINPIFGYRTQNGQIHAGVRPTPRSVPLPQAGRGCICLGLKLPAAIPTKLSV